MVVSMTDTWRQKLFPTIRIMVGLTSNMNFILISEKLLAFTLLKSRNNGLITVYDVSRSQSNLVSVNAAPYAPSNSTSLYGKYDGHGIVVHDHRFGLVRLSVRGELSYNALAFDSSEEYTPVVEWTTALQDLKTTTATICSDAGPLDEDRPHIDLGPVYHGKKIVTNSSFYS